MAATVSIDGTLVRPEDAKVSIFDRGFLYGDSVYEVLRTYRGHAFMLHEHLARLEGSATRIGMKLPVSLATLAQELKQTHQHSGNAESYVRVVVSRGSGELGLDPGLATAPLRIVLCMPVKPPPAEYYENGSSIALVNVRRNLREAIDPLAKTGNYLNSVMALAEAKQRGAYEAVMLNHHGYITEGASSNVFIVIGGALFTPPLDAGILKGVTRDVVFEVAKNAGLRVLELPLTPEVMRQADEVFITSSIRELVPIVKVDDAVIGAGRPGPVYQRVHQLFRDYVEDYVSKSVAGSS